MPKVLIPPSLQRLTNDEAEVRLRGKTVREVVANLEKKFPAFRNKLLDGNGELRKFIGVFVNKEDIRAAEGVKTPVGEEDEVSLVPAVAGGT
ncbi:MAG: ubiquitin-like small modifier protein 1 [bacterium]